MSLSKREKEIVWGIAAIVVLAAVVAVFTRPDKSEPRSVVEDEQDLPQDDQVRAADKNDILLAFPQGTPIEASAIVQESYVFVPANSDENQSTLEYISQRSVEENASAFSGFFTDRGFQLANEVVEEGLHFFYTTKEGNDLSVLIDGTKGAVRVTVSYLER